MSDFMLDLETMGIQKNAAILSIAAVPFDQNKDPDLQNIFYEKIDPECYSKYQGKFSLDISTIKWWMQQIKEVREEAWMGTESIQEVLWKFKQWNKTMYPNPKDVRVWSHGKDFDVVLMEHAFNTVGIDVPWKFWNTMDTRTAYFLAEREIRPEFEGIEYPKHHPVGDCLAQIDALKRATCPKTEN
jgi:hypothetical protein